MSFKFGSSTSCTLGATPYCKGEPSPLAFDAGEYAKLRTIWFEDGVGAFNNIAALPVPVVVLSKACATDTSVLVASLNYSELQEMYVRPPLTPTHGHIPRAEDSQK
jgi:hypothetical protein